MRGTGVAQCARLRRRAALWWRRWPALTACGGDRADEQGERSSDKAAGRVAQPTLAGAEARPRSSTDRVSQLGARSRVPAQVGAADLTHDDRRHGLGRPASRPTMTITQQRRSMDRALGRGGTADRGALHATDAMYMNMGDEFAAQARRQALDEVSTTTPSADSRAGRLRARHQGPDAEQPGPRRSSVKLLLASRRASRSVGSENGRGRPGDRTTPARVTVDRAAAKMQSRTSRQRRWTRSQEQLRRPRHEDRDHRPLDRRRATCWSRRRELARQQAAATYDSTRLLLGLRHQASGRGAAGRGDTVDLRGHAEGGPGRPAAPRCTAPRSRP